MSDWWKPLFPLEPFAVSLPSSSPVQTLLRGQSCVASLFRDRFLRSQNFGLFFLIKTSLVNSASLPAGWGPCHPRRALASSLLTHLHVK